MRYSLKHMMEVGDSELVCGDHEVKPDDGKGGDAPVGRGMPVPGPRSVSERLKGLHY